MRSAIRRPVRVLVELRAALDKQSGIPQQTRLLFRGLSSLPEVSVEGLIQSSTHALGRGLPLRSGLGRTLSKDREISRLAQIVIMLEQRFRRSSLSFIPVMLRRLAGRSETLYRFEPESFRDFIWRRLFARSLPATDLDLVTRMKFRVARTPWTAMHLCGLITKALGFTIFPRLDSRDTDVFIAETPYPARVSRGSRLVIRYHDAVPLLMPHTIKDRRLHHGFHYRALRDNIKSGAWFVCVSEATRRDLVSIFPDAAARSVTIHNIVSHEFFDESSDPLRVSEIVRARRNIKTDRGSGRVEARSSSSAPHQSYLLIVSTVEPRKNHLLLLSAWERLKAADHLDLKLIVVGSLGWHHHSIMTKFRPWIERSEVHFLEDVPASELRVLYKQARATICPSLAEGFDLSGVEAMRCGGVVVASDIPVHREIYGDAAEYFNPYSVDDLQCSISRVIGPSSEGLRSEAVTRGNKIAQRYSVEQILPQWLAFIRSCQDDVIVPANGHEPGASNLTSSEGERASAN
jgi:glycosyltransferase involved in cell wall biosynthesis